MMPKLRTPKHFINFIKHTEAYKKEFFDVPQRIAQRDEEDWNTWMPKGEAIKAKLFGYTKNAKTQSKAVKH